MNAKLNQTCTRTDNHVHVVAWKHGGSAPVIHVTDDGSHMNLRDRLSRDNASVAMYRTRRDGQHVILL